MTERVEVLDLVAAGNAPLAKRLFLPDDRDADKNRGTTKVFVGRPCDAPELSGAGLDLQNRDMLLMILFRNSSARGGARNPSVGRWEAWSIVGIIYLRGLDIQCCEGSRASD